MARAKGTGTCSPIKRGGKPTGRWRAQITVTGETKGFSADSKSEATKLANAWAAEQRKQPARAHVTASDVELGVYLPRWLETAIVRRKLEIQTVYHYRSDVKKLTAALGHIRLRALTQPAVQRVLDDLQDDGLGASAIRGVVAVITGALKDAVKSGLIPTNVAQGVTVSPLRTPEQDCWTMDEKRAFLDATDQHPWQALWHVMLATGIRNGEARALRWDDINRQTGHIQIRRQLSASGRVESLPKSHKPRTVVVRGEALAVLQSLPPAIGYLAADELGRALRAPQLRAEFRALIGRAGVSEIRVHGTRHTCATHMLQAGVPIHVVSKMLGHSSPVVTARVYSHVIVGDLDQAAEALARATAQQERATETG